MPEMPEIDAIATKLTELITGEVIRRVKVENHLLIYGITVEEFEKELVGKTMLSFRGDGKFLIMKLSGDLEIVINPMLTGRIKLTNPSKKPGKQDVFRILVGNQTLWYTDRKQMGRVYLVKDKDSSNVAEFDGRGPSPLDPDLTLDVFSERIRHYRGQIKNVLRNQRFVKGIGNAYADEILLYAGILPFRKRSSIDNAEIERLYNSMKALLTKFCEILSSRSLEEIGLEKRDFLMIHGKTDGVCPLCGNRISEVKSNRFKTNYCQKCQT